MKTTLPSKNAANLLAAVAMAAAAHFSPTLLAADMGLRGDSSITARGGSPVDRAPVAYEGRREADSGLGVQYQNDARTAIRRIESDARELYATAAREIRHGSRDQINALNRVSDLQRAAFELTVVLDRRDCSPELASRQYRAFVSAYDAARASWQTLCNVRGARDYTVRIESCYSPVTCYFEPRISWREVHWTAARIEDAAEHLYDTAARTAGERCDRRTHDARQTVLAHLRALRDMARDFDRHIARCGADPRHSRDLYRRLASALECAEGAARVFGPHARRDFDELDALVQTIAPFYTVRGGYDHGYGHGHDHDDFWRGGSWSGSWGSSPMGAQPAHGGPRVIGSVR